MEGFEFFEYSPLFRQMMILQALSEGLTSHSEIALKAGIVPSLVNKYLRDFLNEELVKKERGKYKLTSQGIIKLNYLRLAYLSEISNLYKDIETKFQDIFLKLVGKRDICIYGAGVVGKMIFTLLANKEKFNLVAFLDEDNEKIGKKIEGIPILSLNTLIQVDAVIVASFKNAETMMEKALKHGFKNVYTVEFLKDRLRLIWRG
ncbi:MAG: nucleoside-diphosphate sugar epimerase [Fervidobacterium sp.]|nr:nucleoside-diphosphate sugar epimerase [Fervidobacterium sp.]